MLKNLPGQFVEREGITAAWRLQVLGAERTQSAAKSNAETGFGTTRKIQELVADAVEHGGNKDSHLQAKEKDKDMALATRAT